MLDTPAPAHRGIANPTVRAATTEDIPLLALFEHEASKEPFGRSMWSDLLEPFDVSVPVFLEAVFASRASAWGNVEDFLILEIDGVPAGGCAVFRPSDPPHNIGSLDLRRLSVVAERLSWDEKTALRFRASYLEHWGAVGPTTAMALAPQAETIIETVAVLPAYRGKGLGHALMDAAKARARDMGAKSIGIMVILGNDGAQRLYEAHFEPWATFHTAFFDGAFPGLAKYRAAID